MELAIRTWERWLTCYVDCRSFGGTGHLLDLKSAVAVGRVDVIYATDNEEVTIVQFTSSLIPVILAITK